MFDDRYDDPMAQIEAEMAARKERGQQIVESLMDLTPEQARLELKQLIHNAWDEQIAAAAANIIEELNNPLVAPSIMPVERQYESLGRRIVDFLDSKIMVE